MLGFQDLYTTEAIFKATKIVLHRVWNGGKSFKQQNVDLTTNFNTENKKQAYSGNLCKDSRKRLCDCIDLFAQSLVPRWIKTSYSGKKRVYQEFTFLTLTISSNERRINGKEGYQMLLEPMIQWLRRQKGVNTYIWKAELQNPIDINGNHKKSNGQLHYHLIFPNWIEKTQIRNKWNELQRKNGLLDEYYSTHKHYNAPSIYIEKPKKNINVCDYITKEIAKDILSSELHRLQKMAIDLAQQTDVNRKKLKEINEKIFVLKNKKLNHDFTIGGKVWGCSENLQAKKSKGQKMFFRHEFSQNLENRLNFYKDFYSNNRKFDVTEFQNDYVKIIKMPKNYQKDYLDAKKPSLDQEGKLIHAHTYKDEFEDYLFKQVGNISYDDHIRVVPIEWLERGETPPWLNDKMGE